MSLNNVSNTVNTNNINLKSTTKSASEPKKAPQEKSDNSKKLLLALGGLAAIGVATYLITQGKKDKVENAVKDTLPQTAQGAGNKAKNAAKDAAKDAAKKAAKKDKAVKNTSKKAAKAKPAPQKAGTKQPAPAPEPVLSKADKMKDFTGEKTIVKKDGTKTIVEFKNGKPTGSVIENPDGTYTAKMYEYDKANKLETVTIAKVTDMNSDPEIEKILIHNEDGIGIINGKTLNTETLIVKKENMPLDYEADFAVFKSDKNCPDEFAGTIEYYKDGKITAIETEPSIQSFIEAIIPKEYANIKMRLASKPAE